MIRWGPGCTPSLLHSSSLFFEGLGAVQALFSDSQYIGVLPCFSHNILWAAVKKINSTPARPSTVLKSPILLPDCTCTSHTVSTVIVTTPTSDYFGARHKACGDGDSFFYAFQLPPIIITFPGLFSTTVQLVTMINENGAITLLKLLTQEDRLWALQKFPLAVSS